MTEVSNFITTAYSIVEADFTELSNGESLKYFKASSPKEMFNIAVSSVGIATIAYFVAIIVLRTDFLAIPLAGAGLVWAFAHYSSKRTGIPAASKTAEQAAGWFSSFTAWFRR